MAREITQLAPNFYSLYLLMLQKHDFDAQNSSDNTFEFSYSLKLLIGVYFTGPVKPIIWL